MSEVVGGGLALFLVAFLIIYAVVTFFLPFIVLGIHRRVVKTQATLAEIENHMKLLVFYARRAERIACAAANIQIEDVGTTK